MLVMGVNKKVFCAAKKEKKEDKRVRNERRKRTKWEGYEVMRRI